MHFRTFAYEDALFCHTIRKRAFTELFPAELTPAQITACVDAYALYDYLRMQKAGEFFIAEENGTPRGFFTLRRVNRQKAEIPLFYLDPDHRDRGLGRECMRWLEQWVVTNWEEVTRLSADTVIPRTNGGFYEAMGFTVAGETICRYAGLDIPATRYAKDLQPSAEE
jgi:GNAT superfamily N-acetyltransferase